MKAKWVNIVDRLPIPSRIRRILGVLCLPCKLARRTYSFQCPLDILGTPESLHECRS